MRTNRIAACITGFLVLLFAFTVFAQPAGDPENGSGDGKHKRRGMMRPRRPRLMGEEEARRWLEKLREYRQEAARLGQNITELHDEMRELHRKHGQAETEEEKAAIRKQIDKKMGELDDAELEMAEKQVEFTEKSFDLALRRLISAKVEYEETKRRIDWRRKFVDRFLKGKGPAFKPGEGPPPDGPHPDRPPQ